MFGGKCMNKKQGNKRLSLGHFGDSGDYDAYNPFYTYSQPQAPEILYLIASREAYTLNKESIVEKLNIGITTLEKVLNGFVTIQAIDEKDGTYKINFPFFLEEDLPFIEKFSNEVAKRLGDKIIGLKPQLNSALKKLKHHAHFPNSRWLYHIIGQHILDGTAIEYLGEKDVICLEKQQPGNRQYLLIGYEESDRIAKYSDEMLCSNNGYMSGNVRFSSFGDCNGDRRDMYRFFRKVYNALGKATEHTDLNFAYIKLNNLHKQKIAQEAIDLVLRSTKRKVSYKELNISEQLVIDFLKELNYVEVTQTSGMVKCKVPVFEASDNKVLEEISHLAIGAIYDETKEVFDNLNTDAIELMCIRHKVHQKEVANELWHQIFGTINEYLVETGFFAKPIYNEGEGRYLQNIFITT